VRIRRRLALYGAAVTGVAMLAFGLLLGGLATGAAPSDQDKTLAALAAESADSFLVAAPETFDEVVPFLATDVATSTDQFVAVVTAEAGVIFTTGLADGALPVIPSFVIVEARETGSSATVVDLGGTEVRLHAMPFERADLGISGAVVAGQSTAAIDEQLAGLRAVIVVLALMTMAVASIVSWLVTRRALRPLQVLAETSDEIGHSGDSARRLPPSKARDEVGRLTSSFNEMLDRVESGHDQLESSLAAQRRFVADASHELRSPLTTVRNNAGFLIGHPEAEPRDRTEAIADIAAEAERMANLVDDLLELARADTQQTRAGRPVEVRALIEAAAHRAERHGHTVEVEIEDDPIVLGDFDALARLVWILVHNAATHGGGEIRVGATATAETVQITVTDGGPGVPEHQLGRVFERFYRADPARSPAGAGLGLPIAESIVHSHDGTISLANRDDGGLVATIALPRAN
jgi:two-component system, OmpR family, sensor kinase